MSKRIQFNDRQQGFTLIVSLILLALVSMVAVASMRGVSLELRMSAASQDRNLAYQSAEAALRAAETQAVATPQSSFPSANCQAGLCAAPAATDTARWNNSAFNGWQNAAVTVTPDAPTPAAIIEDNGDGENWPGCSQAIPRSPNCLTPRYRVTARATAADRATVVLQSDVAAP